MMRWIKASEAKKKYNIPDRLYREACHGAGSVAIRPGGKRGHFYFEVGELERFLKARMGVSA